jgi:hypothetical protein
MFKVALLAMVVILGASTAAVESGLPEPAASVRGAAPCHPEPSTTLAPCVLRSIEADADGDGPMATAELAKLILPAAPLADWTLRHPAQELGLDFKDAAVEPGSVLSAKAMDRDHPQPAIPALFALGALVVLLRRRPT